MKVIAHRAKDGSNWEKQNEPKQIEIMIKHGFDCEIDLRVINNLLYLGHDLPEYEIFEDFLINNSEHLFIHCKDFASIKYLKYYEEKYGIRFHYFTHENDRYHLTSLNKILTSDLSTISEDIIYISPELFGNKFAKLNENILKQLYGIMTAMPLEYENLL